MELLFKSQPLALPRLDLSPVLMEKGFIELCLSTDHDVGSAANRCKPGPSLKHRCHLPLRRTWSGSGRLWISDITKQGFSPYKS